MCAPDICIGIPDMEGNILRACTYVGCVSFVSTPQVG